MHMAKLVSVVMPVYNGAAYLRPALDSVLRQTYSDLEVLVIDDGSTDASASILEEFTARDRRTRLITHLTNQGLTASLNEGLALASGEYVARMDADDLCRPHRLARQVDFMEKHPEVGACGSWVRYLGTTRRVWRPPTDGEHLKCRLFWDNSLAHPSVMLRRRTLEQYALAYDVGLSCAQDYDLWVRCSRHFRLANIPEVLLDYRIHPSQVGAVRAIVQQECADGVRLRQVAELGIPLDASNVALHQAVLHRKFELSADKLRALEEWLVRLQQANGGRRLFDEKIFARYLAERWAGCCRTAAQKVTGYKQIYRSSTLYRFASRWEKISVKWKRVF